MRDGGYYNDWDFDRNLVEAYLQASAASGIDVVELGFRFLPKVKFLGPYAYTTERFLEGLPIPQGIVLCVMVNASEYLNAPKGPEATIREVFSKREDSKVAMVRVAAHVADVEKCAPIVKTLRDLGYRVGLNIMQSNACSDERLVDLARAVREFEAVEVLYFADSLGNMNADSIRRIVAALRKEWFGPLGFHGHDNVGTGVSNTLTAAEAGVTWLDATVMGMGRGAGNAQTEYLLAELNHRGLKKVNPPPLIEIACKGFLDLKRRYDWGTNVYYYIGALHGVHPTYVQDMLAQDTFSPNDIAFILEMLGQTGGASYKATGVFNALTSRFAKENGNWSACSAFTGRSALIVAGGPSAQRHWPSIEEFIERENPLVVTLNRLSFVPQNTVAATAVCHPGRLVPFIDETGDNTRHPLITPFSALPASLKSRLKGHEIWDYGMRVEHNALRASEKGCTVSLPLVAAYAMCAAIAGGAESIFLAGLDGYDGRDKRFHEMNNIMLKLQKEYSDVPILSLTSTHYEVPQQSVYIH